MGFDALFGHTHPKALLQAGVLRGRLHHALLFEGPVGVGKATAARALAQALNCERPSSGGCGACLPCTRIAAQLHPDVLQLDMTPKKLTLRTRELVTDLGYRPHEGRARVVILDPAEALSGPYGAAEPGNTLLKTLEEPPADTYFVLVTAEPRRLPVTIRSRCQRVRFGPLHDEELAALLRARGIDEARVDSLTQLAGGSPGRALDELAALEVPAGEEEPALHRGRRLAARTLACAPRFGKQGLALVEELGGEREVLEAACQQLSVSLRDGLLASLSVAHGQLRGARAQQAEQRLAEGWTATGLLGALALVDETLRALRGNVAPLLALEHLLLGFERLLVPRGAQAS